MPKVHHEITFSGTMQYRTNTKKEQMMLEKVETWVVYLMTVKKTDGMKAVCEQTEWDAIEKVNPRRHQLIKGGIASESEAELLARGTSGDSKPRTSKRR